MESISSRMTPLSIALSSLQQGLNRRNLFATGP